MKGSGFGNNAILVWVAPTFPCPANSTELGSTWKLPCGRFTNFQYDPLISGLEYLARDEDIIPADGYEALPSAYMVSNRTDLFSGTDATRKWMVQRDSRSRDFWVLPRVCPASSRKDFWSAEESMASGAEFARDSGAAAYSLDGESAAACCRS